MELPLSLSLILVSFITYSMYLSIALKKRLDDKVSEIAELKSTLNQQSELIDTMAKDREVMKKEFDEYSEAMEEVDDFYFSEWLEYTVKNRNN